MVGQPLSRRAESDREFCGDLSGVRLLNVGLPGEMLTDFGLLNLGVASVHFGAREKLTTSAREKLTTKEAV